jgi:hypothetical protein
MSDTETDPGSDTETEFTARPDSPTLVAIRAEQMIGDCHTFQQMHPQYKELHKVGPVENWLKINGVLYTFDKKCRRKMLDNTKEDEAIAEVRMECTQVSKHSTLCLSANANGTSSSLVQSSALGTLTTNLRQQTESIAGHSA